RSAFHISTAHRIGAIQGVGRAPLPLRVGHASGRGGDWRVGRERQSRDPEGSGERAEIAMPIGTAFHERTLPLCQSLTYREWWGYYTVSSYEPHHEHEYNAIRNSVALIDISPLYKYIVIGFDAMRLVDRIVTRDMQNVSVGQVI